MSAQARQILEQALQLDDAERAALAADLVASLGPPDDRTDEEWIREVERRARRALAGGPSFSWEEVREGIRRRLHAR